MLICPGEEHFLAAAEEASGLIMVCEAYIRVFRQTDFQVEIKLTQHVFDFRIDCKGILPDTG